MIEWWEFDIPQREQLRVLRRICIRGRSYFLKRGDSLGIDLFEHLETEIGRLAVELNKEHS